MCCDGGGQYSRAAAAGITFDTVGRRRMIGGTYAISGTLILATLPLFLHHGLTAETQTLIWAATSFSPRPRQCRLPDGERGLPARDAGPGHRPVLRAGDVHRRPGARGVARQAARIRHSLPGLRLPVRREVHVCWRPASNGLSESMKEKKVARRHHAASLERIASAACVSVCKRASCALTFTEWASHLSPPRLLRPDDRSASNQPREDDSRHGRATAFCIAAAASPAGRTPACASCRARTLRVGPHDERKADVVGLLAAASNGRLLFNSRSSPHPVGNYLLPGFESFFFGLTPSIHPPSPVSLNSM